MSGCRLSDPRVVTRGPRQEGPPDHSGPGAAPAPARAPPLVDTRPPTCSGWTPDGIPSSGRCGPRCVGSWWSSQPRPSAAPSCSTNCTSSRRKDAADFHFLVPATLTVAHAGTRRSRRRRASLSRSWSGAGSTPSCCAARVGTAAPGCASPGSDPVSVGSGRMLERPGSSTRSWFARPCRQTSPTGCDSISSPRSGGGPGSRWRTSSAGHRDRSDRRRARWFSRCRRLGR